MRRLTRSVITTEQTRQVICVEGDSAIAYIVTPIFIQSGRPIEDVFKSILENPAENLEVLPLDKGLEQKFRGFRFKDTNEIIILDVALDAVINNCQINSFDDIGDVEDIIVVKDSDNEDLSLVDLIQEYEDDLYMDILPLIKLGYGFEFIDAVSDIIADYGVGKITTCIKDTDVDVNMIWQLINRLETLSSNYEDFSFSKIAGNDIRLILEMSDEDIMGFVRA